MDSISIGALHDQIVCRRAMLRVRNHGEIWPADVPGEDEPDSLFAGTVLQSNRCGSQHVSGVERLEAQVFAKVSRAVEQGTLKQTEGLLDIRSVVHRLYGIPAIVT